MLVKLAIPAYRVDNECSPRHWRWVWGWTAPGAVGIDPSVGISNDVSLSFLRWDFMRRHAVTGPW
jgi:hypothetical protein